MILRDLLYSMATSEVAIEYNKSLKRRAQSKHAQVLAPQGSRKGNEEQTGRHTVDAHIEKDIR